MNRFIDPGWEKIIHYNGLDRFDSLWNLPFEPLDEPNRRGAAYSFSQVGLADLNLPDGTYRRVVIKKQQNYATKTLRHPIEGIPTFESELRNILTYRRKKIPVLNPVLLSVSLHGDATRAVLLTEYLEGYVPLDRIIEKRTATGGSDRGKFMEILRQTAKVVRRIHNCGFRYGCLYPKHVFVKEKSDGIAIRLIDLENSRYRPIGRGRVAKDLETLYRHGGWKAARTDLLRFLLAYTGESRPGIESRAVCRRVTSRNQKKGRRTLDDG